MTEAKLYEKWLRIFARGVDNSALEAHVTSDGNLLWHIFSWKLVDCLCGDEARRELDSLSYEQAIGFRGGYSGKLESIQTTGRLTSAELDRMRSKHCDDYYLVAEDFSWTYVVTHEGDICGPYFCRRERFPWE